MSTVAYNSHEFNLQTKLLERQAYDLAIAQAKKIAQNEVNIMAHRVSSKICSEAFDHFVKSMQTTFPIDLYKDLIILTLQSREVLFYIHLKEQVINILRNINA